MSIHRADFHQPVHVCEANTCQETSNLFYEHGAHWCKVHIKTIILLRNKINDHNGDVEELTARYEEILLRKHTDPGHVHYYNQLNESHMMAAYAQHYYAALNNYYQSFYGSFHG